MKKEFMEPEMKRIELNLKENIAESPGDDETYGETAGFTTRVTGGTSCYTYVVGTQVSPSQLGPGFSGDAEVWKCYRGTAEEAINALSNM